MIKKERLFTPGPTALLPQAQAAMAAMALHHRTAEFKAVLSETLKRLQAFLETRNDVLILASSGTGAMEASVANLTSPGDRVLVLSAGKFGERWEKLTKTYGCDVDVVKRPYGEGFGAEDLKGHFDGGQAPKVVYVQATESSTAIQHDIEGIARAARKAKSDVLIVVDAITGIGTQPLDIDGWGLDIVIGGSQKAVMMAPGLAYLSVSERAFAAMAASKNPKFYFNLTAERKSQAAGETAFTAPVGLVAALHASLEYIASNGGRKALTANAEALAAATRAAVEALGLRRFGTGRPAGAMTAVSTPEGMDSGALVKALRQQFGSVVANGQADMKGKMIRIAHLGYYDFAETLSILAQLEIVLVQLGRLDAGKLGAGVRAAQTFYLEQEQATKTAKA